MSITRDYTSLTRKYAKFSLVGVLAVLALVVLAIGGKPESAQAAPLNCPKFRVMHNDKIGNVSFPAGYYNVTVLNSAKLSCAQSTKLFQEFLQDWDGKLRSPWILRQNGNNRVFRAGAGSDMGFRATPSNAGGNTGGNSGRSCPGYFIVLHNDSIGSFKVPRGKYRITLIDPAKMNCTQAVKRFQEFLLDFDGRLPAPWKLNQNLAIFYKSTAGRTGFKINKVVGPNPPGPVNRFARCPATFRVLHNDRIGALYLPRGPYYVYVVNNLSCAQASNLFRNFLQRTDGRLPSPWRLNVPKAKFNTGTGGPAFRVQKA